MDRTHTSRTAVLIFAHSSREEVKHKAIAKGAVLFDVLTSHTLETVEKTGLPYFHYTEEQQSGATFGLRFSKAIQDVYKKGYDHIITIGNDSPQLKPEHIFLAESQLKSNRFVLGPSTDGGFYLMGLHKSQFDIMAFQQLAWQTSELSKQLLCLLSKSTEVYHLQTLIDIDTVADIRSLMTYAYLIPSKILRILSTILTQPRKTLYHLVFRAKGLYYTLPPSRGSPFLLQSA